jgi:hypothetical protein
MMKLFYTIVIVSVLFTTSCSRLPDAISGATSHSANAGNSLYYKQPSVPLKAGNLEISGEIKNPGAVIFKNLYLREIIVKEAIVNENKENEFQGAYRYIGYSLLDILNLYPLDKKNAEQFKPQTDLYIVIRNQAGERVVFSWSEIFHTSIPHQIILATESAPIVPYRKEVKYPVSSTWKIVSSNDLYAFRNLEKPVSISVNSFDKKYFEINRELSSSHSDTVKVFYEEMLLKDILPEPSDNITYHTHFYGMGMGYHPTDRFSGKSLPALLKTEIDHTDKQSSAEALVCFTGIDGYRAIFSFSEIFNRADQLFPILAISQTEGGYYRMFHPADFYADRSVKSLKEIFFFYP